MIDSKCKRAVRFLGVVLLATTIVTGRVSIAAGAEDGEWQAVTPGVEVRKTQHRVPDTETVITLHVVRVDPHLADIVVLDAYSVVSVEGSKYASYSLRDLKRITSAAALINGGFNQSFSLPVSAGLVVQDRVTTSRLNRRSRTQSGVFCVNDGGVKIVNKSDYQDGMCRHALQSGPKIVEYPGENGITAPKRSFIRSVACIDEAGRVLLVRASSVTLFYLAEILRAQASEGGFGCQAALNLSGDVDSGLLYEVNGEEKEVGGVDGVIASAIAILPKSSP